MYSKLIGALLIALGTHAMASNSASIDLQPNPSANAATGAIDLSFNNAFVTQGSYSGIRLGFSTCCPDKSHSELTLFIPAHDEFWIGYDSRKGEFSLTTPEAPFVFQAEKISTPKDRFGRSHPMQVTFSEMRLISKNHWSEKPTRFTDCKIEIDSLSIKERHLTFSGDFTCRSSEPAASASGAFSVENIELGVSKVD